jgi:catechol 2,3-dioxygenase-like lactoylglutathione lyase family enzyme
VNGPPSRPFLRHVALNVRDLEACEGFYVGLVGLAVEWRPDPDNVYLSSGADNLALHRGNPSRVPGSLDHIGFTVDSPEQVDAWHSYLSAHGVALQAPPRTHRDGARSFYCRDPDGNLVQFIYYPPLGRHPAGEPADPTPSA